MKSIDFTLKKYGELCEAIVAAGYKTFTVKEYLSASPSPEEYVVVLRHDVDRKPKNAFRMSALENEFGLSSTYYFRYTSNTFKKELIRRIHGFNQEIGYHYETLSKAKGRYEDAIRLFEKELNEFRNIVDVQTICMHGSPLSKWDNRWLWEKYDFREFDIIGEVYLSIDYSKIAYFTDTGRSWDSDRTNIRDRVQGDESRRIKSTDQMITFIRSRETNHICIQTHPERWDSNLTDWIITLARDGAANIVKTLITQSRQTIRSSK